MVSEIVFNIFIRIAAPWWSLYYKTEHEQTVYTISIQLFSLILAKSHNDYEQICCIGWKKQ